jgi:hypothetical protein
MTRLNIDWNATLLFDNLLLFAGYELKEDYIVMQWDNSRMKR